VTGELEGLQTFRVKQGKGRESKQSEFLPIKYEVELSEKGKPYARMWPFSILGVGRNRWFDFKWFWNYRSRNMAGCNSYSQLPPHSKQLADEVPSI